VVGLKVLYRHSGRARSTWIVSNGSNVVTVRAVLKAIDVRTGTYSYEITLNEVPKFVVEVPSPEGLSKKVLEVLKGAQWW
jgi:Uma2 family endonuclease